MWQTWSFNDWNSVQAFSFSYFSFQQNPLFLIKVKHKRMCCCELLSALYVHQIFMFSSKLQLVMQYIAAVHCIIPVSFQTSV